MKDIFKIDEADFDPYLDELFMKTAIGGIATSLLIYNCAIREGIEPEEAYNMALSPIEPAED